MKIPDLISPIVGHRVWRWDGTGLRSLNGKPWPPRQALAAKCGAGNAHDADEPPHLECTCGVYAAKNIAHLRQLGYAGRGIRGEVHLWGTVVEHELGWRAQFAYPKTLFLPPELIPSDTKEMEARLGALAAYDIDIFMLGGREIPLWRKGSGFDAEGLDYLIGKRTEYYVRRQRDRTLMKGDRVAVLGRGISVVEHADETEVEALLGNKTILKMRRKDIAWSRLNMRWEAEVSTA